MKLSTVLVLLSLFVGLVACDKHSFKKTQVLHEGMHKDHHGDGHGHGDSHAAPAHGDSHAAPAHGEAKAPAPAAPAAAAPHGGEAKH